MCKLARKRDTLACSTARMCVCGALRLRCLSVCVRRGGRKDMPGHVAFTLHDPERQTSALATAVMHAQVSWSVSRTRMSRLLRRLKTGFCPNFLPHFSVSNITGLILERALHRQTERAVNQAVVIRFVRSTREKKRCTRRQPHLRREKNAAEPGGHFENETSSRSGGGGCVMRAGLCQGNIRTCRSD